MSEYDPCPEKEPEHEPIKFDEELRRYLTAEPFHDVEIVTTSGDRYEITGRWQVAFGLNAIVIVRGKYGVRIVRKSEIVAIHVEEPAV